MFAVLTTGGKQYRVEPGIELDIERIVATPGSSITFDRVLLVGDGDDVTVGTPTVAGASVTATVLGETLGPKVVVFKFKPKAKYRRRTGHRQHLVRVRIDGIHASGRSRAAEATKPEGDPVEADGAAASKPRRSRAAGAARGARTTAASGSKAGSATVVGSATTSARRSGADEADRADTGAEE